LVKPDLYQFMGRKGKKGRRGRSKRGGNGGFVNMGGQTVTIPFRKTFNLDSEAAGFNTNSLNIYPSNLGEVADNLSLNFTWYRVVKLKIRFCPGVHAVNSESYQFAAAYNSVPTIDESSGPPGLTNMAQFPTFQMSNGEIINIVVPRKQLLSVANKWFRCTSTGSPPADEFTQGCVWIASLYGVLAASVLTHVCLVEGEIQFRSTLDASDLLRRKRLEESKRDEPDVVMIPSQPVPTSVFKDVVFLDNPP